MMTSKLYHDAVCFMGAVDAASRDRSGWSAGERAALKRIGTGQIASVIRMRRRCFFVVGEHTFVVERTRGGGFTVTRVPST
jgi:hypothetical protein